MLTRCSAAIRSSEFTSSRQIHLACSRAASGGSVWGKAPCSRRDEETKPQNVTSLKYERPQPSLYLLAQGFPVTPGDFSSTFTYTLWCCQWHLGTNDEHSRKSVLHNCLVESFLLSFSILRTAGIWTIIKGYNQDLILFICFSFFFWFRVCVNGIYTIIWIFIMISGMLYPQRSVNHLWMSRAAYTSMILLTIHFWNVLYLGNILIHPS